MRRRTSRAHLAFVENEDIILQDKPFTGPEQTGKPFFLNTRDTRADYFGIHFWRALADGRSTDARVGRGVRRAGRLVELERSLVAD